MLFKSKALQEWLSQGKLKISELRLLTHQKEKSKKQLVFKVKKQSSTVAFTARGLYKYSLTDRAQIDEAVAPQMVDNRTGQVVTPEPMATMLCLVKGNI